MVHKFKIGDRVRLKPEPIGGYSSSAAHCLADGCFIEGNTYLVSEITEMDNGTLKLKGVKPKQPSHEWMSVANFELADKPKLLDNMVPVGSKVRLIEHADNTGTALKLVNEGKLAFNQIYTVKSTSPSNKPYESLSTLLIEGCSSLICVINFELVSLPKDIIKLDNPEVSSKSIKTNYATQMDNAAKMQESVSVEWSKTLQSSWKAAYTTTRDRAIEYLHTYIGGGLAIPNEGIHIQPNTLINMLTNFADLEVSKVPKVTKYYQNEPAKDKVEVQHVELKTSRLFRNPDEE